jgi:release factor glutamine methyltransferase
VSGPAAVAPGTSRAEAVRVLRRAFAEAGLPEPERDARLLVLEAAKLEPLALVTAPDMALGEETSARLNALLARRLAREPLDRIRGHREFWGLDFALGPDTLSPRPDSETVVAAALVALPEREAPTRLLDLGTGSGCLLIALLHERPQAVGVGLDRSPGALAVARANAARNGVGSRFLAVCGDWAAALRARFDLVISNPPYIPSAAVETLDPEVHEHDPRLALDGGADGLDAYRRILRDAGPLLAPGGRLVLEIGAGQADDLDRLGTLHGYAILSRNQDLGGHVRALTLAPRPRASQVPHLPPQDAEKALVARSRTG